jgi:hypothetical protein
MAYRIYKRRRYSKRRTDWREYNARKREEVSARYGGIDHDVRQMFFNLAPAILTAVFRDYRERYGSGACRYANETYEKWKSGDVEMSGEVSERLLAIVPRHLDLATKYDLLAKLWRQRQQKRIRLEINADADIQAAIRQVINTLDNAKPAAPPNHIVQRLNWLTSDDGLAAQALLSQVLARESEMIAVTVEAELRQLFRLCADHVRSSARILAQRLINVPGAIVEVVIVNRKSRWSIWRIINGQ